MFRLKMKIAPVHRVNILTLFFCLLVGTSYAATPAVGTISPAAGSALSNTAVTLTCTYSDGDGWANLKTAYLLIGTSSSVFANKVYLYYDQNTNKLYLRNDANTSWLGGYAPGSASVIENTQVKLNCKTTAVSGSGNIMTVKWNVIFKPVYAGKVYSAYLKIADDTAAFMSWTKKGTFCVFRQPVNPP